MKQICATLIGTLIFLSTHGLTAQSLDSLSLVIEQNDNEPKVDALNLLSKKLYRTDTDSAIQLSQLASELAESLNYTRGVAEAQRRLGLTYGKKDQFDKALEHLLVSQRNFKLLSDSVALSLLHNNIAGVYRNRGEYSKSLNEYLQGMALASRIKNLEIQAMIHNNIGILYKNAGEYDSAVSHYFRSLDIKKKVRPNLVGSSYTNIGLVKIKLKDYEEAENYLQMALDIDIEQGDAWGIANNQENLGLLYLEKGELDQAQEYFRKAIDGFKAVNTIGGIANNQNYLGEIYFKKGQFQSAIAELKQALRGFEKYKDEQGEAKTWINLARCNMALGNLQKAITQSKKALEVALPIRALPEAVEANELLFNLYGKRSDKRAYEYAQRFILLKDSLFDQQKLAFIAQLESRRELSSIEQQNRLLSKENELKEKELEASNFKIQRQRTIQYALIICLIFGGIAAILGYQYYNKKIKTINLLQALNSEINMQKEKISSQAEELQKVNGEMKNMNQSLEFLVKERTRKIESQNKKLREYAFSNSHEVRAPLSNLLGLIDLSKHPNVDKKEQLEILEQIYLSAIELDDVITRVNKILEEEEL
jgi:tetratricopeptide (TPR) repeat protein